MKRTRIISAFPGCGKSYFHNNNKEFTTLDSDSSNFSWVKDENGENTKERNPDFPNNYIQHIKDNIGKVDIIFVSSHEEVRYALKEDSLHYYLIYPKLSRKEEFIQRYIDRGSPQAFINLITDNWDQWINILKFDLCGCTNIEMVLPNLSDEIYLLIASENGELEVE